MNPEDILKALEGQGVQVARPPGNIEGLYNQLLERSPSVSNAGVPDMGFRADFSRMDTDEERERFLSGKFGDKGWKYDEFGRYVLTPESVESLGLPRPDMDTTIEEPGFSKGDIGDLRGDAPAIAGATIGGIAAGPLGFWSGVGITAATATIAKTIDEILDSRRGENTQSVPEVAGDIAGEAAMAATGEGVARGILGPIGRKLMAPEVKRLTEGAMGLIDDARAVGAQPSVAQVTKAPILGRMQNMMDNVLGETRTQKNTAALTDELRRLATSSGRDLEGVDPGDLVRKDILDARKAVSDWSESVADSLDEMSGGSPVVPTQRLKKAAGEILGDLPRSTKTGEPIFASPELVSQINKIVGELPDSLTLSEMQRVTNRLWDAVDDGNIIPGIGSRDARQLWRAAVNSYGDIQDEALKASVKSFRSKYKEKISQFDNALVKRIMRDDRVAGHIPPERIVSTLFRKGVHTPMQKVMRLTTPETQEAVRRYAMDDILRNAISRTDDPLESVITGRAFLESLDKYGRPTLEATFGKKTADEMYKFGRVAQFVTQRMKMSGGIVAANIALHPIKNLGRLVQLNIMSKYLNSKTGFKHFTEGFKAPRTRKGAMALSRAVAQLTAIRDEELRRQDNSGETQ